MSKNFLPPTYDAATGGNIVNQVQRTFNGLGQLTNEYQSHSGAVVQGSTPEVQYGYTEMSGGQNNSRLTSLTYPSGYVLNYNYNTGLDSNISRLSSISDASNTLESYKYLGLATVVERDHPQNNVNLSYIEQGSDPNANHDGGDQYTGLDRFGRVIDQNWVNATTGTSTDRFQYGYSQDSDVLYRQNLVDTAMSELYSYDNLHQLVNFQRGTLNSTHNGIVGSPSHSQSWTPDALGNFTSITTDGTTDTRTANQQNEYTSSTKLGTPSYDANGNLTADGSGNTYVYDAWNRLVAVNRGGSPLATYGYDGLGRRITETHGTTTTDLYLSAANQVLEERVGGVAQARNVWSPVGVNALVLRDQSSQHNGTLDQRLYVQQDANWNVTALVDASGNVVERYDYDPFGLQTVLNPDFSVRSSSAYAVTYGFQGMRTDSLVGVQFADNRVYSPTLMRWLQTDPLGLTPDNNDYRFVSNEPLDSTDPSGLANPITNYWNNWVVPAGQGATNRLIWLSQRGNPFVVIPENVAMAKALWADPRGVIEQTGREISYIQPLGQIIGQYKATFPEDPTDVAIAQRIGRANGAALVDTTFSVAIGVNIPVGTSPGGGTIRFRTPPSPAQIRLLRQKGIPPELVGLNDAPQGGAAGFNNAGQMARNGTRPVVAQATNNTCGPQCVDMILETVNPGRTATSTVNLQLGPGGTTIDRLATMLSRNGTNATWRVGYGIDDIAAATARGNPLIAHVRLPGGGGHFVIVDGVTTRLGQRVVAIRDPTGGRQYFELASEFSQRMSGQVVTLP